MKGRARTTKRQTTIPDWIHESRARTAKLEKDKKTRKDIDKIIEQLEADIPARRAPAAAPHVIPGTEHTRSTWLVPSVLGAPAAPPAAPSAADAAMDALTANLGRTRIAGRRRHHHHRRTRGRIRRTREHKSPRTVRMRNFI